MSDNKIDILINAVNRTKPAFDQIRSDFANLKETVSGVSSTVSATGGVIQKLAGDVRLVAEGFLLLKGFSFFSNLASEAARVQSLTTVLHQVASNAGITAGAIDKVDKSVQALGITAADSKESLTQFIQAGLQATDAAKLARAAQDLAVISGETSSNTFKGLTQAISEMSIMMLRYRGIMVTNEEAQARYAAQVGKSVASLADWEKKTALLNLVLEKSSVLTGIYEAAMGDVGKQASSLARYQNDAAVAIQNGLLPAYGAIVQELTKFLVYVKGAANESLNSSNAADSLGDSVRSVASAFRSSLEFIVDHRVGILKVVEAYALFKLAQKAVGVAEFAAPIVKKYTQSAANFSAELEKAAADKEAAAAAAAKKAATKAASLALTEEAAASAAATAATEAQTAAIAKQNAARLALAGTTNAASAATVAATATSNAVTTGASIAATGAALAPAIAPTVAPAVVGAAAVATTATNAVKAEVALTGLALVMSKVTGLFSSMGGAIASLSLGSVVGGFKALGGAITNVLTNATTAILTFMKVNPVTTILSIVASWVLLGDGMKDIGKAIDYVSNAFDRLSTSAKVFWANRTGKTEYAADLTKEQDKRNAEYYKEANRAPAFDGTDTAYAQAQRNATLADQARIQYEYQEAPKAKALKASTSKDDQDKAIQIEKDIVEKKIAAQNAQAIADAALQELRTKSGKKAADYAQSRLDKEAYLAGLKFNDLRDVAELTNATQQIGQTHKDFGQGAPISMETSTAFSSFNKILTAYSANTDGAEISSHRLADALEHLMRSAKTAQDYDFVDREQLKLLEDARLRVLALQSLTSNSARENPNKKGTQEYAVFEVAKADMVKMSQGAGISSVEAADTLKSRAEQLERTLDSQGNTRRVYENTRASIKTDGKLAVDQYDLLKKSGNISSSEDAKVQAAGSGAVSMDADAKEISIREAKIALVRDKLREADAEAKKLNLTLGESYATERALLKKAALLSELAARTEQYAKASEKADSAMTLARDRDFATSNSTYRKSESLGSTSIETDKAVQNTLAKYTDAIAKVKTNSTRDTDLANAVLTKEVAGATDDLTKNSQKLAKAASDKKAAMDRKGGADSNETINERITSGLLTELNKTARGFGDSDKTKPTIDILTTEAEIARLTKVPEDARTDTQKEEIKAFNERLKAQKAIREAQIDKTTVNVETGNYVDTGLDDKQTDALRPKVNAYVNSEAYISKSPVNTVADANLSRAIQEYDTLVTTLGGYNSAVGEEIRLLEKKKVLQDLESKFRTNTGDKELGKSIQEKKRDIDSKEEELKKSPRATLSEGDKGKVVESLEAKGKAQKVVDDEEAARRAGAVTQEAAINASQAKIEAAKGKFAESEKAAAEKEAAEIVKISKEAYDKLLSEADKYYNTYKNKINAVKDIKKATLDMLSGEETRKNEDSIDAMQIRMAPDKAGIGTVQARESQQKFEAGASKYTEELAAIEKLVSDRKRLARESGADEKVIAREVAAADIDSIAKRLEASRSYFTSLDGQRREAKAKWKQYADEVVSIDKEIRSSTIEANASMRDTMRSVMHAPAQLQDLRKEYQELIQLAKEAASAGDFDQAKEYAKKAGSVAKSINGHEGGLKLETNEESLAGQGEAARLLNSILGQQGEIAKKNRDEQLEVVASVTEAMNGLAKTISDLSTQSEITLNPKLDLDKVKEIEEQLRNIAATQDNAIALQFKDPELSDVWSKIVEYADKNPVKLSFTGLPDLNRKANQEESPQNDTNTSVVDANPKASGKAAGGLITKAFSTGGHVFDEKTKDQHGIIQGVGTGTSDSIPALLSHGEFVIKQDSVNHYGKGFLDLLNSKVLKFATGGFVSNTPVSANAKTLSSFAKGGEMDASSIQWSDPNNPNNRIRRADMPVNTMEMDNATFQTLNQKYLKDLAEWEANGKKGVKPIEPTKSRTVSNDDNPVGANPVPNAISRLLKTTRAEISGAYLAANYRDNNSGNPLLNYLNNQRNSPDFGSNPSSRAMAMAEYDHTYGARDRVAQSQINSFVSRYENNNKYASSVSKFASGGFVDWLLGRKVSPELAAYRANAEKERAAAKEAGKSGDQSSLKTVMEGTEAGANAKTNQENSSNALNKRMAAAGLASGGFLGDISSGAGAIGNAFDQVLSFVGLNSKDKRSKFNTPTATIGIRGATGGLNDVKDGIPALVSNGEFRVSPDAVRHYGANLISSVNDMSFPKFAEGGLIGSGSEMLNNTSLGEVFNHIIKLQPSDPTKSPIPLKARSNGDVKSMLAALRTDMAVNLS